MFFIGLNPYSIGICSRRAYEMLHGGNYEVLILILLEYALGVIKWNDMIILDEVLILILMEYALGGLDDTLVYKVWYVS